MIKQMIEILKNTVTNFDEKILRILKIGFRLCFGIAIVSVIVLIIYLFFVHSIFLYQIGLMIFQISLCFTAEFIVSAIAVDTISKQLI